MFRFHTFNSIYEVDPDNRRIRRVVGANQPTSQFGTNGEWHDYHEVAGMEVGSITPVVYWPGGGYTRFSPVVAIQRRLFNEDGAWKSEEVPA